MSSTANMEPDNAGAVPVDELTVLQMRQEKIRIERELKEINKQLRTPKTSTPGTPYDAASAPESLQRKKRLLEQRLKQVNDKLKLEPPVRDTTASGELSLGDPNYGVSYTLQTDGQVIRSIPRGQWTQEQQDAVAAGTMEPPTTSGYLLGNVLKSIPPGGRYWKEDIGSVVEDVVDSQQFKNSIYTRFLNKPDEVIAYKQKLKEIFPEFANEPMNGDVSPLFLDAMATVAGSTSELNYYRRDNQQSLFTLEQGLDYLINREQGKTGRTTTSKQYFSMSDADARLLLEDYFGEAVGRRPTKEEVEKFTSIVKKRAGKRPRVEQTITSADTLSSESRVLEEGFGVADAQLAARRQAEAGPEFEAYRLASSYYPALLRAIGSPVNIEEAPGQ